MDREALAVRLRGFGTFFRWLGPGCMVLAAVAVLLDGQSAFWLAAGVVLWLQAAWLAAISLGLAEVLRARAEGP